MSIDINMIMMILIWILKALGIFLLSCLVLILLALLLLLFVPIRYGVQGALVETLMEHEIKGRCSWLFRIVHIPFTIIKGEVDFKIKILGITVYPRKSKKAKIKKQESETTEDQIEIDPFGPSDDTMHGDQEGSTQSTGGGSRKKKEATRHKGQMVGDSRVNPWNRFLNILGKPKEYYHKFKKFMKKLKWHFKQLCDMIKRAIQGKETIIEFIGKEPHKVSFHHLKSELLFIWKHSRPKKLTVTAKLGFEDPATTGQAMAALGMAMPFIGEYDLDIRPYFEEEIMEMNYQLKGRVYLYHILLSSVRVIRKKENRLTFKALKRLKI